MNNEMLMHLLEAGSVNWPSDGIHLTIRDLRFDITVEDSFEETYDILLVVHSESFCKFLNNAAKIQNKLKGCPSVRYVGGSSETALLGQILLEVLNPGFTGETADIGDVYFAKYKIGSLLLPLGYSITTEDNLICFVRSCYKLLCDDAGLLEAYMKDGFLVSDFAGFDPFYGYIYACYVSSKSALECFELLPESGVIMSYPKKLFNVENVTLDDVLLLYQVMDRK